MPRRLAQPPLTRVFRSAAAAQVIDQRAAEMLAKARGSEDAFDALVSAMEMAARRAELKMRMGGV